jgi:hypothetical protein
LHYLALFLSQKRQNLRHFLAKTFAQIITIGLGHAFLTTPFLQNNLVELNGWSHQKKNPASAASGNVIQMYHGGGTEDSEAAVGQVPGGSF